MGEALQYMGKIMNFALLLGMSSAYCARFVIFSDTAHTLECGFQYLGLFYNSFFCVEFMYELLWSGLLL